MSTQETIQDQDRQPTKEELVAFLNESIEISELRAKLQNYNTQIAVGRAEELKALVFIAQITNPKEAPQQPEFDEDEETPVAESKRKLKREQTPTE
jgi:hypothetical protein